MTVADALVEVFGARLGYRHQKVQRLRRLLRRRSLREQENVFVIEGIKLLREALDSSAAIESIFVDSDSVEPEVLAANERGVRVHMLEQGLMARVADTTTPQPVCAIVSMPSSSIDDLLVLDSVVVLVDVRDPGNAGTIIRSAEASGIGGVAVCDGSVDVWNPKTVRSSAGAVFHVPVVSKLNAGAALDDLRRSGFERVGTAVAGEPYDTVDMTGKIALVFGNEANGLPEGIASNLDSIVSVPIEGRSESLNVSMAAAVLCFEASRQRRSVVRDMRQPPAGLEGGQ